MNNIQSISDEKKCFGCFLCGDICPTNAIAFHEDEEGFMYPNVNVDNCIECGICVEKCPVKNDVEEVNYEEPRVYGAWNKDDSVINKSTSGGLFSVLSDPVLNQNGKVFGAQFCEELFLHHGIADSYTGIDKMRGSKYLQSNCTGVYSQIKDELDKGRKVLFSGTPCQVAAVKSCFGDQGNLFLLDIICHGVNSPGVFKEYKGFLEKKYKDKLIDFKFRYKKAGWMLPQVEYKFQNRRVAIIFDVDSFISGFRKNIYLRPSCHTCPYSKTPRPGDITIGDFWGVPKSQFNKKGVSCLLVNSKKGEEVFGIIKNNIICFESDFQTVVKENPQLRKPVLRTPEINKMRNAFFSLYKQGEIDYIFKRFVYGFPFPLLRKYRYYYKYFKKRLKYR